MPWLFAILVDAGVWLFKNKVGLFIAQILLWLGISYGTQKIVLGPLNDLVAAKMAGAAGASGVGAAAWAWIGVLKFDVFASMMMSAIAIRQATAAAKISIFKRSA